MDVLANDSICEPPRLSLQGDDSDERTIATSPAPRSYGRSNSIRSLLEPTKAIDEGWSWVIVAASFVLSFMLYGVIGSFGVIYVPLTVLYSGQNESSDSCASTSDSTNGTRSVSGQTAWIGNTATLLIFSLGPFAAALSKRWGVRPVVLTGSIIFSTGIILTSLTNEMWQAFLTYGIVAGVGGSMIHSPGVGIVPTYFHKRKTLAVCITQVGGSIGTMAMSAGMGVIESKYGWRRACYFAGGISCLTIPASFLYRPRYVSETTEGNKTVKEIVVGAWKTQRHPRFALWVWLIGLHFFSLYVVVFHIYRHSECVLGISKYDSSFLLTYASAASVVVSIAVGYVSDHLQYRLPLLQLFILIGGIGNVFFPLYRTYADLVGFMILFGINMGYLAIMNVFPSDFVGVDEAVNAFSILSFTSSIFGTFGGPAAGWIFDATGSYNAAFVLSGILSICVSLLMSLDRCLIQVEEKRKDKEAKLTSIEGTL